MAKLSLWLHREERDSWLVSRSGLGAGVYLPKTQIALEDGHPLPLAGPVGPVRVVLPDWLAEDRGLLDREDEAQGGLF